MCNRWKSPLVQDAMKELPDRQTPLLNMWWVLRMLFCFEACNIIIPMYGIIFVVHAKKLKRLPTSSYKDGYDADSLHGDLSRSSGDYVMNKSCGNRNLQLWLLLMCKDDGLDVDDVTRYQLWIARWFLRYTHRSAKLDVGKAGTSIVIIHVKEKGKVGRQKNLSIRNENELSL